MEKLSLCIIVLSALSFVGITGFPHHDDSSVSGNENAPRASFVQSNCTVHFLSAACWMKSFASNNQSQPEGFSVPPQEPLVTATWLVRDGSTSAALTALPLSATLQIAAGDGKEGMQFAVTTNAAAEFSISLPVNVKLTITFKTAGYHPITITNFQLDRNHGTAAYMEPLLFISSSYTGIGSANGVVNLVNDGFSPRKLAEVTLEFRANMNNRTGVSHLTRMTSTDGSWNVALPTGHYAVTASKSGCITTYLTVVVIGGQAKTFNVGMPPVLNEGEIRIIVKGGRYQGWLHLALHVRGPVVGSWNRSHVYDASRKSPDGLTNLDVQGWIYNSILITEQISGAYAISVHDYHKRGKVDSWVLANSNAVVQIYRDNSLWAEYFVPNRMGNAWSVAEINGSQLTLDNAMKNIANDADVY